MLNERVQREVERSYRGLIRGTIPATFWGGRGGAGGVP